MKIRCKVYPKDGSKYTIVVPKKEDFTFLWSNGCYGYNPINCKDGWGILSLEEALYLEMEGVITLKDSNNNDFKTESIEKTKKTLVYCDLRRLGWIVRSGINYGTDYIVYRRSVDEEHAPFAIKVVTGQYCWRDLIATNRAVTSSKKELILATFKECSYGSDGGGGSSNNDGGAIVKYSRVDRIC